MTYRLLIITSMIALGYLILSGCSSSNVDSGKFLVKAMQDGMAEVQVCQLAIQRSSNDDVKRFAQRMIEDHNRIDEEIVRLAKLKNVSLPHEVSSTQKSTYEDLSKLTGKEFDKAFMEHNVEDHETDVKDFQEQSEKGSDAEVKAFAERTLQMLKTHLGLSKELDSKVKS